MSQNLSQLLEKKLAATDGEFGHVKDVYFDDVDWAVRYLVADTGTWLPERQVLISPRALLHFQAGGPVVGVRLSRQQIEQGPPLEAHQPVSRQYEEEFHRHHGWPYYWQDDRMWGASGSPVPEPPASPVPNSPLTAIRRPDPHLRSARALLGYKLNIDSKPAGEVTDFILDTVNWVVESLVVKAGRLFLRRPVLIPADTVTRISFDDSTIFTRPK